MLRHLRLFSSATKRYRTGKTHKALLPKLKLASSFRDAGKTHRIVKCRPEVSKWLWRKAEFISE